MLTRETGSICEQAPQVLQVPLFSFGYPPLPYYIMFEQILISILNPDSLIPVWKDKGTSEKSMENEANRLILEKKNVEVYA